jgi:1-acyl-sn-glycerol-3-phosphate acyltransferase
MKTSRIFLFIIYQPYKWLFYYPFFFINTFIFGILAVIFSTLFNPKVGSYIGGVIWSKISAFFVPMIPKVYGKENIQKNTSYIVISNHQSYFDVFLIYGWIGLDIKFIMKAELRKIPGLGMGSEKVGHIFLDRSNSRAAVKSLEVARKRLVNGTSVVVFPEGTRSVLGIPGNFKRGGFKLALDLGLPILPVTVINTKNILPANSINLLPGFVKMVIHKPVSINNYSEETMPELMKSVREIINSGFENK